MSWRELFLWIHQTLEEMSPKYAHFFIVLLWLFHRNLINQLVRSIRRIGLHFALASASKICTDWPLRGLYTGTVSLLKAWYAGIRQRYRRHFVRLFCQRLQSTIHRALQQIVSSALTLESPNRRLHSLLPSSAVGYFDTAFANRLQALCLRST